MAVRYFYDTEFLEDGKTIELISIGIICEDGREYYAVNSAITHGRLLRRVKRHDWLMDWVVPHLPKPSGDWNNHMPRSWLFNYNANDVKPRSLIATEVEHFLTADLPKGTDVELWADYCAYDHVALAQLWGPMVDLPAGIPMWTNDIQTYAKLAGVSHKHLPKSTGSEHHALADARNVWGRYTYIRNAQKATMR
jgi:hypothetical protein